MSIIPFQAVPDNPLLAGMNVWLAVFLGGGLGSVARFGLTRIWPLQPATFPWATLVANVLATVLLALVVGGWMKGWLRDQPLATKLITTGFCGGFSTFSTFSVESAQLVKSGHWQWAAVNVGVSVLACLLLSLLLIRQG